jgi:hypothetical protein
MIHILGGTHRVCGGVTRRELLRFGSLGSLGLALHELNPAAAEAATVSPRRNRSGSARSLLFISLFGGPSHQDIWDLKPEAPSEVRGEFRPIETNVSGIQITEHLPLLARRAHRYSLIRSMTHEDNGHGSAMYAAFTGVPHPRPNTNPLPSAEDYPAFGAVASYLHPPDHALPGFVAVGGTQIVCGNQIPGQRAGFLGPAYEPFVISGDPNQPAFRIPELSGPVGLDLDRQDRRRALLTAVEQGARLAERGELPQGMEAVQHRAFELLASAEVRHALNLKEETAATRDAYGRNTFGQSLLLGRRLIESGVPCVTVNWSAGGPWDTHGDNFRGLKQSLLPPLDHTFSGLLDDLADRGLLDSTLIVLAGEFGRTPQINAGAGRDHWAGVYTTVLAGGGIQGGRVHGTSDASAAYPASDPVRPRDVAATIYHCLGIPAETEIRDRTNRPLRITDGEPVRSLL